MSGGVWGVSGGCLVSVLGLLVVSGGGGVRHFFRSGHLLPPWNTQESRTPGLIGLTRITKNSRANKNKVGLGRNYHINNINKAE